MHWIYQATVEGLRFYTRLPTPQNIYSSDRLNYQSIAWSLPIVGLIIGLSGASILLLSIALGLSPMIGSILAIATLIIVTGGLHEDGLADFTDGLSGKTIDHRLAIMRDSRIGAFGALALFIALSLRITALANLVEQNLLSALLVILVVASLSRVAGLAPLIFTQPARQDGIAANALAPTLQTFIYLLALVTLCGFFPAIWLGHPMNAILATLAAVTGALAIQFRAQQQLGGYTGDVLGAAQQLAEVGALLAFSLS
ncbi:MAG: adenosylcobinamide-GDP ribazoletransferase [Methylocystaceae bacterium]|nr:adenosylcobinamide-GDP ribazoletransferase [Methylocystaceae bacterium]